jgi:hypothetical protein
LGALDLLPQLIALLLIQFDGDVRQAAVGPAQDRRHHLQVSRHLGEGGSRRLGFTLSLGF